MVGVCTKHATMAVTVRWFFDKECLDHRDGRAVAKATNQVASVMEVLSGLQPAVNNEARLLWRRVVIGRAEGQVNDRCAIACAQCTAQDGLLELTLAGLLAFSVPRERPQGRKRYAGGRCRVCARGSAARCDGESKKCDAHSLASCRSSSSFAVHSWSECQLTVYEFSGAARANARVASAATRG